MAVRGPEHGGELRQKRIGHVLARPYVTPTAFELIGQLGHDVGAGHVLVQDLDRGAVAALVNLAQHGGRGIPIFRCRCAFGDGQLVTHRKVELLGVSGTESLPAALELENLEPCCGGP
ncbi:hypothetical protein MSTO_42440 [Mycobacterium stomatepiae]|uniref:Uncharacterized protein n=1 Tax=Mycobacterium stomatepiae TaxID=470076 RepID=A0A7I7QCP7_9MYCO|nr:hypothetical protein MSTO_42440 [Mycobacterium stomatepiae]